MYSDKYQGRTTWRDSLGVRHIDVYYSLPIKQRIRVRGSKRYSTKDRTTGRWLGIIYRAKKKSLKCDLELADVKYIIESPCVYCNSTERIEVDRMDSEQGYTRLNTVPACRRCNTIKNNVVSYEEMMTIVDILGWRV